MTEPAFDEVIHAPNRLQICGMLAVVDAMEFAVLRESLEVSDSVLSKHVKVLQAAGYATVTKVRGGSYPRTWVALTPEGRRAFAGHVAELRRIVGPAGEDRTGPPGTPRTAPGG
ncbi:winged helix-turn-helix domain-containing protein [Streptomyces huiliensis]|uniref:winged helix-turn-helix domain-containing protein n=1 Tax=Streptomyces huiliensis TaxID=2876027 RepID=UPI001CBBEF13|nr:transcriptional regulator [Streptomyces huiliensis]MBZ4320386.1 transcriptional regulator [Streptomyces huiliensis]